MTASARTRTLLATAWLGTAIVVACTLLLVVRGRPLEVFYGLWILLNGPCGVLSLWLGYLVLRRFPRHSAGRILVALGVLQVLHVLVATLADHQLVAAGHGGALIGDHGLVPAQLPLSASVPLLVMNVLWVPAALLTVLLLSYFPNGRLPHRRWSWVPLAAGLAAVLLVAACAADAWPTVDWQPEEAPAAIGLLFLAGGLFTLTVLAAGTVAFVQRWRASGPARRRFEAVGGVLVLGAVLGTATYPWPLVWTPLVHVALWVFLLAYGAAIARFGLHDLEPVVSKGAVVAAVTGLAVLTYLAVVVGIGRLVGARTSDPVLPLVAVAAVALLVEPTRRWVRRRVDRLAYGHLADRAEVLSRLTVPGGILDGAWVRDLAELVQRATGAAGVAVDVHLATGPTRVSVGRRAPGPARMVARLEDGAGEVRIHAHAAGDLLPDAEEVLQDVARLVSVLLDNERLAREVSDQLAATRASRQRIIEAQEQARRELERDVHDGAQARLIAVRMHLGELHRRAVAAQPQPTGDVLPTVDGLPAAITRVSAEVEAAIRDLRELARGLRPPVLEEMGFPAALRAHLRDTALPVAVRASGDARHPPTVEAAAYFACVEAIQNALRHAGPASITVTIASTPEALRVEVRDDGQGFDPATVRSSGLDGIADRVGALGGSAQILSSAGVGTRICLTIPSAGQAQVPTSAR